MQVNRQLLYPLVCTVLGIPGGSAMEKQPAMQNMPIQSLSWEDPLGKELAAQ